MANTKTPVGPRARQRGLSVRTWLTIAVFSFSPIWVPLFFILVWPVMLHWWNSKPFDSSTWKSTKDSSVRYAMSWDLVYGGVLTGKTSAEVEELLGAPMTTDTGGTASLPKFQAPDFGPGVDTWYYDIWQTGYWWADIGPYGAVLAIDFREGKVVGVRKVAH
jgi:hypothetical protein